MARKKKRDLKHRVVRHLVESIEMTYTLTCPIHGEVQTTVPFDIDVYSYTVNSYGCGCCSAPEVETEITDLVKCPICESVGTINPMLHNQYWINT